MQFGYYVLHYSVLLLWRIILKLKPQGRIVRIIPQL
jgi:hypothetical protein